MSNMTISYSVARRMVWCGIIICMTGILLFFLAMFYGEALLSLIIFIILMILGCALAGVAIIFGEKEKYYCPSCGRLQDKEKGSICTKCRATCQLVKGQMSRGYKITCEVLLTLILLFSLNLFWKFWKISIVAVGLLVLPVVITFSIASSATYKRLRREAQTRFKPTSIARERIEMPAPTQPLPPSVFCPSCKKPVQHGWVKCPYCKALLEGELEDIESKVLAYVEAHSGTISISQCAKELGVPEDKVRNVLKELERKGELKR